MSSPDILRVPLPAALPVSHHVLRRGREAERHRVRAASLQAVRPRDSNPAGVDVSRGASDVISPAPCFHPALNDTNLYSLCPHRPAWCCIVTSPSNSKSLPLPRHPGGSRRRYTSHCCKHCVVILVIAASTDSRSCPSSSSTFCLPPLKGSLFSRGNPHRSTAVTYCVYVNKAFDHCNVTLAMEETYILEETDTEQNTI